MINLTKPLHQKTYMPEGYEPSVLDVLCGRGVECFNHSGNVAFRKVIEENLDRYTMSRTKLEKSILVVQIVDIVRNIGGEDSAWFLRKDHKVGKYYEIGDDAARKYSGRPACSRRMCWFLHCRSLLTITIFQGKKLDKRYENF